MSEALGRFLCKPSSGSIAARVVMPIRKGSPHYVFLTVHPRVTDGEENYRRTRQRIAFDYGLAVKAQYPDAREVVVIATQLTGSSKNPSEDLCYIDLL